jgi:glutamate dehydrogenase
VNRAGITFVFRAGEETGANATEITRAYTVAREIFGFEDYWRAIESLDTKVATDAQTGLYLEGRRLLDRSTRWLLQSRRAALDVAAEIEHFRDAMADLMPRVPDLLQGVERDRLVRRAGEISRQGVPEDLAGRAAGLLDAFSLLDVVEIAMAEKAEPVEVAAIYFAASERFEVDRLLTRITALPRDDRWQALARSSLRYDLYSALAGLTAGVLGTTDPTSGPVQRIEEWEQHNAEGFSRAQATLREISEVENPDLATLSVAMRTIRTLLRTSDRG